MKTGPCSDVVTGSQRGQSMPTLLSRWRLNWEVGGRPVETGPCSDVVTGSQRGQSIPGASRPSFPGGISTAAAAKPVTGKQ